MGLPSLRICSHHVYSAFFFVLVPTFISIGNLPENVQNLYIILKPIKTEINLVLKVSSIF